MLGALVALVAGAAGWVAGETSRTVGGLVLVEPTSTPGTVVAPVVVALALAGLVGGALVGMLRGRGRRAAGVGVVLVGVACLVAVAAGAVRAVRLHGALTPAPALAGLGSAAVVAGGALAARGSRPPASALTATASTTHPTTTSGSSPPTTTPPGPTANAGPGRVPPPHTRSGGPSSRS